MPTRRTFLAAASATGLSAGAALWLPPRLFAGNGPDDGAGGEALEPTPAQTEGPFYPDRLPLDTDNDLLRLNDAPGAALGTAAHLTGRVTTAAGEPVRGATVEIWQADANGNYLHSRGGSDGGANGRDGGFQGFGRFLTASDGRYYFRTIRPVPYGGRAPHIHVAIDRGETRLLTTQCYIDGHPMNDRDGVMRRTPAGAREPAERAVRPGWRARTTRRRSSTSCSPTPPAAAPPRTSAPPTPARPAARPAGDWGGASGRADG